MFLQILFLEILQRQSLLEVKSAVTGAVNYSRCICYGLLVQLQTHLTNQAISGRPACESSLS